MNYWLLFIAFLVAPIAALFIAECIISWRDSK